MSNVTSRLFWGINVTVLRISRKLLVSLRYERVFLTNGVKKKLRCLPMERKWIQLRQQWWVLDIFVDFGQKIKNWHNRIFYFEVLVGLSINNFSI